MRSSLTSSRLVFVALGAVIVLAAVGIGVWYGTSGSDSNSAATTGQSGTAQLSHRAFALLYLGAIVHKSRVSILKKWPSPPYQQFTSGPQTCYEWWDKPVALYNLCFQNGLLTTKAIE